MGFTLDGRVTYSVSFKGAGTYVLPVTAPGVSVLRLKGEMQKVVKVFMVR